MFQELNQILGDVDADAPALARSILDRFRSVSPDYAALPDAELLPGIEQNIHSAISALVENRQPTEEELEATERLAEGRARQGVGVDALLVAYRLGAETAWAYFIVLAEQHDLAADQMLAGSERLRQWADELMVVIARAHRRVDIEINQRSHERRAEFVRALVAGNIDPAMLRSEASLYGLDPTLKYVLVRARGGVEGWRVERALRGGDPSALLALFGGDTVGVLTAEPHSAADAIVGVGPAVRLEEAAYSFRIASRNLEVASTLGLPGVHRFDDLGLTAAVVEEHEIGDHLIDRYVGPLKVAGRFGEDLLRTIAVWLENGTSSDRTAEALFIHRNTLRHRLNRFEELVGCDLNEVRCIVEVWWALQRLALIENEAVSTTRDRRPGSEPKRG
ncbi:MAG: helix-turn-helix domain-containing protein [Thermoleophilia bacterium]|nr:helix-turn-helix domain-containing protein [Thermoleophilia bacterium]